MRINLLSVLFAFGLGTSALGLASANAQTNTNASPLLIPFQGRLTNQQGVAYTNGQYTLTFNLYDLAVGGNTLWTERHEKVGVVNGMVNVFMGSITGFDSGAKPVDFSTVKYLGITIDADNNAATPDPEMVPRQMIIPAFYAKNSQKLAGADWSAILSGGTNDPVGGKIRGDKLANASINTLQLAAGSVSSAQIATGAVTTTQIATGTIQTANLSPALQADSVIPPGTVVAYPCPVAPPAGWLLCFGQSYLRSDYPRLFSAIGTFHGGADATHFNVPDYSGRFLRGADTTGGARDPDANSRTAMAPGGATGNTLGTLEADTFAGHSHETNSGFWTGGLGRVQGNSAYVAGVGPVSTSYYDNPNARADTTTVVGGSETRPKNASVYFIIKY